MLIDSKAAALLLALPGRFSFAATLRGQHLKRDLQGRGNIKKLSPAGCTVLERANLCEGLDGDVVPCDEEKREFACEDLEDGSIYHVDNDMEDLAKGKKPDFTIDTDTDILLSALTEFTGDAVIDVHTGRIAFVKGKFGKAKGKGKGNPHGGPPGNSSASRRLMTGSKTVIALRVITSDNAAPDPWRAKVADSIFGTLVGGSDQVNMASQFTKCSHGQLNFGPRADITSGSSTVTNVKDGVCNINVESDVTCGGDDYGYSCVNQATSALAAAFGAKGGADYVMVCMPEASITPIAYAYYNHHLSVYRNDWCTYPTTALHEFGHNFNLGHSGETAEYDDISGSMGSGNSLDDQKKCFNGVKNYQLGWFADRHVDLSPTEGWSGRIYGQTVYDTTTSTNKMFIRISNGCSSCDIYVSFNHDARHHAHTGEGQNRVMVHNKRGSPSSNAESKLRAKLASGGSFTTNNGFNVPITVGTINTQEGWAYVTIGDGSPPTPPPTPVPSTGRYELACGSSAATECNGLQQTADVSEVHELRCCADSDLGVGWKRLFGETCPEGIYGASEISGQCYDAVTFNEGRIICEAAGGRLCTKDEVLADCPRGTGCGHDPDMIWTSTSEPATGSYELACGSSAAAECNGLQQTADVDELHELRCCADSDLGADWKRLFGETCPEGIYGASEIGGTCHSAVTFNEGRSICETEGGRLCTKDEVLADCPRGTGCQHDPHMLWTSTKAIPVTSPNPTTAEPTNGPTSPTNFPTSPPTTNSPTPSPTTARPTGSPTSGPTLAPEFYELACGATYGVCNGFLDSAHVDELHELRCCADSDLGADWKRRYDATCPEGIYGASSIGGTCYHGVTFNEGKDICEAEGGRLCTKDEILAECTRGTGCSHDHDMVWTSTKATQPRAELACGASTGGCNGLQESAGVNELHELRCCADSDLGANWVRWYSATCPEGVYGTSEPGGTCYNAVTFDEGRGICEAAGGRLCTKEEMLADCVRGTGCGHDQDMIWSSTMLNN